VLDLAKSVPRLHGAVTAQRAIPTHFGFRVKNSGYETGEALLAHILSERRRNWQSRVRYKEPAAPDSAKLPAIPYGWTWARLEQLGLTFGGLTKNPKRVKL
jgi:hypothetical protein